MSSETSIIVSIPRSIHASFKAKCYGLGFTQKEVCRRLIILFEQGGIEENAVLNCEEEGSVFSKDMVRGMSAASEFVGVSVPTLRSMIRNGEVEPMDIPSYYGRVMFSKDELKKAKKRRKNRR